MDKTTNQLRESNLQTIKAIKSGLKQVGTQKVLKRLGFTRQNLSQHLREENAEKANVCILNKVVTAIAIEKKIILDRANKTAHDASQLINQ